MMTQLACPLLLISLAAGAAEPTPAPGWVNKGSGVFRYDGDSVFIGVGVSQGITNPSLLAATADLRACAEIAKETHSLLAMLEKDYLMSSQAPADAPAPEAPTRLLSNFAKTRLIGPSILGRWKDPADGTEFSLCALDPRSFAAGLESSEDLSKEMKAFVKKNLARALCAMADEEADRSEGAAAREGQGCENIPSAPEEGSSWNAAWVEAGDAPWKCHAKGATAAAFSPDGKSVLSGDHWRIAAWDLSSGRLLWSSPANADFVAFSRDGKTAVSAGHDGLVHAWDASTGKPLKLRANRLDISTLTKSYMASVTSSGSPGESTDEVAATQNIKATAKGSLASFGVPLSAQAAGQDYMASSSSKDSSSEEQRLSLTSQFSLRDPAGHALLQRRMEAESISTGTLASPRESALLSQESVAQDGKTALSIEAGRTLSFHPPGRKDNGREIEVPGLRAAAFSPDGGAALTGSNAGTDNLAIWDAKTGRKLRAWTLPGPVEAVAFSPNGRAAVLGLGSASDNIRLLRFHVSPNGRPDYAGAGRLSSLGAP